MRKTLLLIMAVALFALVAACGDDDDSPNGTSTGNATDAPTETDGTEPSATEWNGPDNKTPAAEETDGATPGATAPGEVPTAPPPATEGIPATALADESAFLGGFVGQNINQEPCTYDPSTRLTSCPNRGDFAINPPIVGQDITCNIWVINDTPEAIHCTSVDPQQNKYYDIQ